MGVLPACVHVHQVDGVLMEARGGRWIRGTWSLDGC